MGRLFWKFFFVFMLAQVVTLVGVSTAFWLRHRDASPGPDFPRGPFAAVALDAAAATLTHVGEAALRSLLSDWAGRPGPDVYALGSDGRDILGRALPAPAPGEGLRTNSAPIASTRRVELADGRSFELRVAGRGREEAGWRPPQRPGSGERRVLGVFPGAPLAGGLIASLVFATLLAWYVAKPIRSLRSAFDAAARGDLDARVGERIGSRSDELADLGRAFDRTALQLKTLVEGQRRLLHDCSHELRSPLARLQAAVGLARQQPDNLQASMDRIEREAARMDKLIDELLTLSRVETGTGTARREGIDLAQLVNDVVGDAVFEAEAGATPVAFDVDVSALRATSIKGDAEMLHRAVENVVRNAARHTAAGGRIRIVGRPGDPAREIHVEVTDDGPGVPESELQSIFEPFFRGAAAGGSSGHGLGLAIARRVVEAHGGCIAASNREGRGLVVTIRLPA